MKIGQHKIKQVNPAWKTDFPAAEFQRDLAIFLTIDLRRADALQKCGGLGDALL